MRLALSISVLRGSEGSSLPGSPPSPAPPSPPQPLQPSSPPALLTPQTAKLGARPKFTAVGIPPSTCFLPNLPPTQSLLSAPSRFTGPPTRSLQNCTLLPRPRPSPAPGPRPPRGPAPRCPPTSLRDCTHAAAPLTGRAAWCGGPWLRARCSPLGGGLGSWCPGPGAASGHRPPPPTATSTTAVSGRTRSRHRCRPCSAAIAEAAARDSSSACQISR